MSFAPIEIDALARRDSILSAKKTHKNLEDEKKRLENAPSDPYHLVHLVFFFVGMMNWLPMLFFLTAQDYWMYKFRDTSQADYDLNHKTVLQQNFSSAQNLISTVPSLIANLLSARYGHKISMRTRLMVSSLIVFAAFAIFTAFIKIDTDSWQMGFFIMTMTVITLLTMNSALWMLSSLTLVSRFPETYLKVNQYGSNATGIISAVLQLIALSTNGTSTTVALIYFTCGTALVGVNAALTYLAFKLPRFIYFLGDVKQDTEKPTQNLKQIRAVARKMWPIAVMSVVGVITFGFSGISVSGMIVSEEYPNTLWSRKYFIPVINFLLINVVSFIACIFSGPYITPKNAPYIMTLDLCRQIFIGPLVLFCNLKTTNRHLPTLFKHDYQYIIITTVNNFLMSLSITCGLMSTQNINFRCVPIRQTTENTSKAICPTAGGETFDEAMNWYERGSSQNVNVSDNTNTSSTSAISSQCSNGRPRKLAALFRPTTSKASLISERHTIEKRKKSVASLTTEIEPPDPYGLVHVIFFFFGLGMMLPLSFFLTAQQYWMYKFRDPSSEEIDLDHKTELQANFVSFSSISQSVPSVITTILATRYGHKINIRTRLMSTLLVMLAAFVVFTGFIEINTDSWQVPFFFLSMLVSVIITMSGTTALVTVLSLIARFPQTYMKTQMYGSAGAGLFSAILQIFSLAIGKDPKSTALIYFSGGTIVVFLTTVFAYISNYSARFRYHLGDVVADTRKETQSLSDLFRTAKKIYPHVILVIVGVLTNGMGHPNITTLIVSENYGNGSAWNDKYFTPVITFFWADIVNIFGRMFGRPILTPKRAGWYLLVDLSRIVAFCPLYLFCNAKSSHPRHLPILFPHDWQYIVIHSFNMFLAHFFGTCSFLSVKNMIPEDPEQELMVLQNFIGVLSLISSPLGTLWVHVL